MLAKWRADPEELDWVCKVFDELFVLDRKMQAILYVLFVLVVVNLCRKQLLVFNVLCAV